MAIKVQVKRNEPIEKALKRLKRSMAEEGIMRELKERRFFQKPGDAKRKKSAAARKRRRQEAAFNPDDSSYYAKITAPKMDRHVVGSSTKQKGHGREASKRIGNREQRNKNRFDNFYNFARSNGINSNKGDNR